MRYLLLFGFVMSQLITHAQTSALDGIMPLENGQVTYTGVVAVDGANKDELFSRAKRWVATTYKSANDVIQLADKDAGSIIAKGALSTPWNFNSMVKWNGYLEHTLTIDVKDGRYRYTLTDLVVRPIQPSGASIAARDRFTMDQFMDRPMQKKNSQKYAAFADERIKETIADLDKGMRTGKADF